MTEARAWAIRPKWHRLEAPRSYAQRQCRAAGVPFEDVERELTSEKQLYIYRVWKDEAAAAAIVEAAAGRPQGHYLRLRAIAQPNHSSTYSQRFLCRLCSAGDDVEQIPHDRENWCLRHPGQMVWVGPGTSIETQQIVAHDRTVFKAERRFRRLVTRGLVSPLLHARAWEMVRDNAWLTQPAGWNAALSLCTDDREIRGRAALYAETITVLELISDTQRVHWLAACSSVDLRPAIRSALATVDGPIEVLVERIVLWLRPLRRKVCATRIEDLEVPLEVVDTAAIIDASAPYPLWIQRSPQAIAEWDWTRNAGDRDPWGQQGTSVKAWWVCDPGHRWETSPYVRSVAGCRYCAG